MQVNTEESPVLAGRYGIRGVPAFILFVDRREKGRLQGARPVETIVGWVRAKAE